MIDASTRLASIMAILCTCVAAFGYIGTAQTILAERKVTREVVCLNDGCREAKIIARFSEATFLQWGNNADIELLMNGEVKSITLKRQNSAGPLIDLGYYLRVLLGWFA